MTESIIVKLDESTPLPCSIYNPITDGLCGKPATVAYAYQAQVTPGGQWLLQPICRDCALKVSAVYRK